MRFKIRCIYIKTMKKIIAEGKNYPLAEGKRIIKLMKADGLPEKKRQKYMKQVNVLSAFFSTEEIRHLMARPGAGEPDAPAHGEL